ncbi:hypothetical protein WR25_11826 [Diploscapter pachys]|uniref:Uncharacterized protein n=1 Tax=Diploscapter pachys TaxID=2018661 RepID=A0A2A2KLP6_9BILA|nr:hypothetical protein WR25_11826 [Diploscapter pachys]
MCELTEPLPDAISPNSTDTDISPMREFFANASSGGRIIAEDNETFFPEWLIDPNAVDPQTARFIGFVLLNVSTLPYVRHQLAERQRLNQLMSLLNQTDDGHLREIAAQIMRNLTFEDD